ncbi:HAD family hydrolase [Sphingomonas ginkgonis]|uniref:HAD family hydrolase n=1 Tax=Sphingomonas ginkgonis TaxID=2315330 RepID=A0A3R9WS27_9SPHN|nr:HAD-IA family hydrolase [Sphingomonas ginkgonis]RST31974.1 HAD family hydrolase [Sphingomonas ginkgonis]
MSRLAIFDCDGTLVDSGATIHRALTATFYAHGRDPLPPAQARKVIGLSLVEAMATLAPDADRDEHEALSTTYKDAFSTMRRAGRVEEPLYDGVLELLDRMEQRDWLLAVATGKSMRGLKHCLESHGIHARFVSLQTADTHPSKPHPSMVLQALADSGCEAGRSVVIGDTAWDMGMARAAGARAIGALWGYHDEAELLRAGAEAIARAPLEVAAMAEQMVGEER